MIMWIIIHLNRGEPDPVVQACKDACRIGTCEPVSPNCPAFDRPSSFSMTTVPTPSQIASLDDERLDELAQGWRTQALRGDRRAFGVAHAFEVERRKRLRASQLQQLEALAPVALPRPWWKFW